MPTEGYITRWLDRLDAQVRLRFEPSPRPSAEIDHIHPSSPTEKRLKKCKRAIAAVTFKFEVAVASAPLCVSPAWLPLHADRVPALKHAQTLAMGLLITHTSGQCAACCLGPYQAACVHSLMWKLIALYNCRPHSRSWSAGTSM